MMYEKSGPYALKEDPPVWAEYKKVIAAARVGLELKPIILEAKAYGGEDTHMWALPRWGPLKKDDGIDKPFWQDQIAGDN